MILYFRLYRGKREAGKGPRRTGEAIRKGLTAREREVFDHLVPHASYKEIGAASLLLAAAALACNRGAASPPGWAPRTASPSTNPATPG